jgi:hypothetical protein
MKTTASLHPMHASEGRRLATSLRLVGLRGSHGSLHAGSKINAAQVKAEAFPEIIQIEADDFGTGNQRARCSEVSDSFFMRSAILFLAGAIFFLAGAKLDLLLWENGSSETE